MKTVGILALQGDFEAHAKAIEKAGGRAIEVRTREEMSRCDGLILPGGESSTMLKLLEYENLLDPLRAFGERKPIYGTCAGAILLAKEVTHPAQLSLGLMDIDVERNGYGRQIDSRIAKLDLNGDGTFEAVFIRAPIIRRVGGDVRVLEIGCGVGSSRPLFAADRSAFWTSSTRRIPRVTAARLAAL